MNSHPQGSGPNLSNMVIVRPIAPRADEMPPLPEGLTIDEGIFWGQVKEEMEKVDPDTEDFKFQELPVARIRKIMKLENQISGGSNNISMEAPLMFAKACEIFILQLAMRSWFVSSDSNRRSSLKADICKAISRSDIYDFLIDAVPRDEPSIPGKVVQPGMVMQSGTISDDEEGEGGMVGESSLLGYHGELRSLPVGLSLDPSMGADHVHVDRIGAPHKSPSPSQGELIMPNVSYPQPLAVASPQTVGGVNFNMPAGGTPVSGGYREGSDYRGIQQLHLAASISEAHNIDSGAEKGGEELGQKRMREEEP